MLGKVTLRDVKEGIANVSDLIIINHLLDMQSDIEAQQYEGYK